TCLVFTYDSGEFEAVMNKALDHADYRGFPARRERSKQAGKLRGIGVATVIERAAPPSFEAVELRISASGALTGHAGTTDQGQGHRTMYATIVRDRLGLEPEAIRVVEGDTDAIGLGLGTGGSRVSAMGGSAVVLAAQKIIAKGRVIAAHRLEVSE